MNAPPIWRFTYDSSLVNLSHYPVSQCWAGDHPDGKDNLTLILLTWRIWRAHNIASKWQFGFNSAFKRLNYSSLHFFKKLICYKISCNFFFRFRPALASPLLTVENPRYIFIKLVCESCHCGSSELNRSLCAVKLLTCFGVTLAPNVDRETSFVALLRSWRLKSGLWCDLISDATRLESRWKPMEASHLTGDFCGFPPFAIKHKGSKPGNAQHLCTHVHI